MMAASGSGVTAPRAAPAAASAAARVAAARVVRTDMLALFQAISAPNQCISYQYDKNGNVTVKISGTFGATTTWGSASFGCFTWTPAS
jgi:hypothetical protein